MYYLLFLFAKLINHHYLCSDLHHPLRLLGVELKEERPQMNSLIRKQQFLSCKWGAAGHWLNSAHSQLKGRWGWSNSLSNNMCTCGWVGGWGVMFLVFHSRFSYRSDFTAHEFSWTSQDLPVCKYYVAFVCVFQWEAVKCVDPGGVNIWSMFDTIDNVNIIAIVEGRLFQNMMDTAC